MKNTEIKIKEIVTKIIKCGDLFEVSIVLTPIYNKKGRIINVHVGVISKDIPDAKLENSVIIQMLDSVEAYNNVVIEFAKQFKHYSYKQFIELCMKEDRNFLKTNHAKCIQQTVELITCDILKKAKELGFEI